MSVYTSLENKVHSLLQTDFWLQILEALAEELEIQKEEKKSKMTLNDVDSDDDTDLLALCTKYGHDPNLSLNNEISQLRKSTKSITYKILNKTTRKGFDFSFAMAEDREGAVYNTSYETSIYRLVDLEETISNIDTTALDEPFTGVEPEIIFFSSGEGGDVITLDSGYSLDSGWTLDSTSTIEVTKHLCIEYFLDRLITDDEVEYSMTSDYIDYLLEESNYNRRISSIPHVGLQINSVIDVGLYFNNFSEDDNYTIPTIELQSAITPYYSDELEDYTYFVAGVGKKGLPSIYYSGIWDNVMLHLPFTDQSGDSSLLDVTNNYTTTVVGETMKVAGIIGQSIDYNKETYATISSFEIPDSDWSFCFYFHLTNDNTLDDYTRYLFSNSTIAMYYDESSSLLTISLSDGTTTYNSDFSSSILGADSHCTIEYSYNSEELNIYLNSVLEATLDVSGNVGFNNTEDLYLGTYYSDPTNTAYILYGLIDEFSFHNKTFSSDERNFLYTTNYGDHTYLGNRVYRIALTESERQSSDDYFFLQGIAKANTVNDEYIYTSDGSTESISGTTRFFPINSGSLTFYVYEQSLETTYTITDDGAGNLIGDNYSGTIDNSTGEYTLNFYEITSVDNTIYSESGSQSSISIFLTPTVQESSFYITYTYNGETIVAQDNGIGEISSGDYTDIISSSSIDYDTGEVSITFTDSTDSDTSVYYSYEYRIDQIPSSTSTVTASFQTEDDLEITECGYENSNGEVMQYTSFPKCQFGTEKAFLSNNTIIGTDQYALYFDDDAEDPVELYYDDDPELVIYGL